MDQEWFIPKLVEYLTLGDLMCLRLTSARYRNVMGVRVIDFAVSAIQKWGYLPCYYTISIMGLPTLDCMIKEIRHVSDLPNGMTRASVHIRLYPCFFSDYEDRVHELDVRGEWKSPKKYVHFTSKQARACQPLPFFEKLLQKVKSLV